jgi:hypothetical protein
MERLVSIAVAVVVVDDDNGLAPSGTAPGSVVLARNNDSMAKKEIGTYTQ